MYQQSTDSIRLFAKRSNVRHTAECCLPRLRNTSTSNVRIVFACCVRVLFAFRYKRGFTLAAQYFAIRRNQQGIYSGPLHQQLWQAFCLGERATIFRIDVKQCGEHSNVVGFPFWVPVVEYIGSNKISRPKFVLLFHICAVQQNFPHRESIVRHFASLQPIYINFWHVLDYAGLSVRSQSVVRVWRTVRTVNYCSISVTLHRISRRAVILTVIKLWRYVVRRGS